MVFESRLAGEMCAAFERQGGMVQSAPAMRELLLPESPQALEFCDSLLDGRFDVVMFQTGVGARALMTICEQQHPREAILSALAKTATVARGPKPVAVMREWGLTPTLVAPEPNTWRQVLGVLDRWGPVAGKRIAIQEYGEPSQDLQTELRRRGAEVTPVAVYAWALPEDCEPLRGAIRAIADGQVDVIAFSSGQQIRNVLSVAAELGLEAGLRESLKGMVIGSIGPSTTEVLRGLGLGMDFEPDRPKMGDLVRGLGRNAHNLLRRKRASLAAGVDTSRAARVELIWPADECGGALDPLQTSPFLRACRREPTDFTPIWLMRQAGRYQREYREIRAKVSFLEMCKRPELAAEVTLMAAEQLGVDAAIIFADILLPTEPMGLGLSFQEGRGPQFERAVRTAADVEALPEVEPAESLAYVGEAIRMTRRALHPATPLIGFCGAPFTVASYMVEGGPSKDFTQTKSLMYRDPGAWHALLDKLLWMTARYLDMQIDAGVQAVQLFDSWVGCLNEDDFERYVLSHTKTLIEAIKPGIPIIYFGTNTSSLLRDIKEIGADVIGLDWRVNLAKTWATIGHNVAVQGNLDPCVLFSTQADIKRRAEQILDQVGGRPGHIFNLGHGILPHTPVDHVIALIDAVHEYGRK